MSVFIYSLITGRGKNKKKKTKKLNTRAFISTDCTRRNVKEMENNSIISKNRAFNCYKRGRPCAFIVRCPNNTHQIITKLSFSVRFSTETYVQAFENITRIQHSSKASRTILFFVFFLSYANAVLKRIPRRTPIITQTNIIVIEFRRNRLMSSPTCVPSWVKRVIFFRFYRKTVRG